LATVVIILDAGRKSKSFLKKISPALGGRAEKPIKLTERDRFGRLSGVRMEWNMNELKNLQKIVAPSVQICYNKSIMQWNREVGG